jgi:hypothetical protein
LALAWNFFLFLFAMLSCWAVDFGSANLSRNSVFWTWLSQNFLFFCDFEYCYLWFVVFDFLVMFNFYKEFERNFVSCQERALLIDSTQTKKWKFEGLVLDICPKLHWIWD